IGDLFELLRTLNRYVDSERLEDPAVRNSADFAAKVAELKQAVGVLRELTATVGLFRQPVASPSAGQDELAGKLMTLLIDLRAEARKTKNFAMADAIRKRLGEIGVVLEDRPDGTGWSVQK